MGTIIYLNNEARICLRMARQRAAEAETRLQSNDRAGASLWHGMARDSFKEGLRAASNPSGNYSTRPEFFANPNNLHGGVA